MTVLSAMQSAAIRLYSRRPNAFFGSPETFELELTDLVNEVARDVATYRDWQALVRVHTLTGDGVARDFPLPADYDRQLLHSDVQDLKSWIWGYTHVADINDFLHLDARDYAVTPGMWAIWQDRMRFAPAPPNGETATFPYITANIVRGSNGQSKRAFDSDGDSFLLPERLLTLGLVWRWRENKGLAANGDQEAFVKALDEYAAKDGGSTVIRSRRRVFGNAALAWPWTLGPA